MALRGKVFGLGAATLSGLALVAAATAAAAPQCEDIAPHTRMCTRAPGQTAIITSPDPAFANSYPWGFGTLGVPVIGPGGGFWVGF